MKSGSSLQAAFINESKSLQKRNGEPLIRSIWEWEGEFLLTLIFDGNAAHSFTRLIDGKKSESRDSKAPTEWTKWNNCFIKSMAKLRKQQELLHAHGPSLWPDSKRETGQLTKNTLCYEPPMHRSQWRTGRSDGWEKFRWISSLTFSGGGERERCQKNDQLDP